MALSNFTWFALGGLVLFASGRLAFYVLCKYARLRHIKGPTSAGFSPLWLIKTVGGGRTHLDLHDACKKYGSIVRVGPNQLITDDPGLWKHVLQVRSQYTRSDWYNGMRLDPGKDNVLSARDDNLHRRLRSKMVSGYSGKEVDGLEAKIDENILRLLDLLENKYINNGQPFDFARKAQFLTIDVITDLAFGKPWGDVQSDSDMYEYIGTMEQNMPLIVTATVAPWLITLLQNPVVEKLFSPADEALGIGKAASVARQVAAERFGPNKITKRDMLGSFISHGLTQPEAESEILIQIMAGSDTTATALRATLLHIITNPRVVDSLRKEIDATELSTPIVADSEARNMPYLQAVIKEGLRIHPPVVGLQLKEVPKGGDSWNGVFLPEGTKIGWCGWSLMRRPDIWGKDADEFRPERWLESSAERLKEMESTFDLVFAYGRWQCLGKNVALLELNKALVELVRRYDLTLVDPTNPWKTTNCGIFLQSDLWVRGSMRS